MIPTLVLPETWLESDLFEISLQIETNFFLQRLRFGHGAKLWYPSEHQNRWDSWMFILDETYINMYRPGSFVGQRCADIPDMNDSYYPAVNQGSTTDNPR